MKPSCLPLLFLFHSVEVVDGFMVLEQWCFLHHSRYNSTQFMFVLFFLRLKEVYVKINTEGPWNQYNVYLFFFFFRSMQNWLKEIFYIRYKHCCTITYDHSLETKGRYVHVRFMFFIVYICFKIRITVVFITKNMNVRRIRFTTEVVTNSVRLEFYVHSYVYT